MKISIKFEVFDIHHKSMGEIESGGCLSILNCRNIDLMYSNQL